MKKSKLTELEFKQIILETVKMVLKENSCDYVKYDGEIYEFGRDDCITLVFYNGKWLNGERITHRNLISYFKFGCNQDDLFDYYSYENAKNMYDIIDMLWSKESDFKYMSRLFYTKGKTKEKGIKYILTSWSKLNEAMIDTICKQFNVNRNEIVYIEYNVDN